MAMVPAVGAGPYGGGDATAGQGGGSSSSSLWDRNHLRPRRSMSLFGARENVVLPDPEPPPPRVAGDVAMLLEAFSGSDTSASVLERFVAFGSAELCSLRYKGSPGYISGERTHS